MSQKSIGFWVGMREALRKVRSPPTLQRSDLRRERTEDASANRGLPESSEVSIHRVAVQDQGLCKTTHGSESPEGWSPRCEPTPITTLSGSTYWYGKCRMLPRWLKAVLRPFKPSLTKPEQFSGEMMEYFYNKSKKKTVAHLWLGTDTSCTMFSTGGLIVSKKETVIKKEIHNDLNGKRICLMCQINFKKLNLA